MNGSSLRGFEMLPVQHEPLRFHGEMQGVSGPWPCPTEVPSLYCARTLHLLPLSGVLLVN